MNDSMPTYRGTVVAAAMAEGPRLGVLSDIGVRNPAASDPGRKPAGGVRYLSQSGKVAILDGRGHPLEGGAMDLMPVLTLAAPLVKRLVDLAIK